MDSFAEKMGSFVANLTASVADRAAYLADLRQECEEARANREQMIEETRKDTQNRGEAVQELLGDFASRREELRADLAAGAAIWAGHGGRRPRAERKEESEASPRKKHRAKRH